MHGHRPVDILPREIRSRLMQEPLQFPRLLSKWYRNLDPSSDHQSCTNNKLVYFPCFLCLPFFHLPARGCPLWRHHWDFSVCDEESVVKFIWWSFSFPGLHWFFLMRNYRCLQLQQWQLQQQIHALPSISGLYIYHMFLFCNWFLCAENAIGVNVNKEGYWVFRWNEPPPPINK